MEHYFQIHDCCLKQTSKQQPSKHQIQNVWKRHQTSNSQNIISRLFETDIKLATLKTFETYIKSAPFKTPYPECLKQTSNQQHSKHHMQDVWNRHQTINIHNIISRMFKTHQASISKKKTYPERLKHRHQASDSKKDYIQNVWKKDARPATLKHHIKHKADNSL